MDTESREGPVKMNAGMGNDMKKIQKRVFVDGYNVINSWGELKDLEFGIAREKLIESMGNYGSFYGSDVTVVFDAHRVPGNSEVKDIIGGVEVVFTRDGETADAYIERNVDLIGKKVEVLVVTSDSLEQQIIFGRGASRMSSKEFHLAYQEAEKHIRLKTKESGQDKKHRLSDRVDAKSLEKLEKMRREG